MLLFVLVNSDVVDDVANICDAFQIPVVIVPTVVIVFCPTYAVEISKVGSVAVPPTVMRLVVPVTVLIFASVYVVAMDVPFHVPVVITPVLAVMTNPLMDTLLVNVSDPASVANVPVMFGSVKVLLDPVVDVFNCV